MKFSTIILALLTFFLDLMVFGLLLELEGLVSFSLISVGIISLIVLLIGWKHARKKGYCFSINIRALLNFLISLRKYMKVNYQAIAIASIGIIIGTIAFGQAIIVANTSFDSFMHQQIDVNNNPLVETRIETSLQSFVSVSAYEPTSFTNNLTMIIQNKGFKVTKSIYYGYVYGMEILYNTSRGASGNFQEGIFTLVFYSPDMLEHAELSGSEPVQGNEFLFLYHQRNGEYLGLPKDNKVLIARNYNLNPRYIEVNITGYLKVSDELNINTPSLALPMNLRDEFLDFVKIQQITSVNSVILNSQFYTEYNQVFNDANQATKMIQTVVDEIQDYFFTNIFPFDQDIMSYDVYSSIQYMLQNQSDMLKFFKLMLLSLSVPIIVLAGFIISFTNNLLANQRKRVLFMLKQRGASEIHLLGTNLLELLMITLFSGIIGGLLAIPTGSFFASTTDLLQFEVRNFFNIGTVSFSLVLDFLAIAFALTITFNLNSAIQSSQITYLEASDPESTKKGFIARFNLDIISLVIGIVISIIMYVLQGSQLIMFLGFFLVMLMPFGFFGLTVGAVMVFTRTFEDIIIRISRGLWKRTGRLPAFALRNLALRKKLATKVTGLFMIGFIFFMFFTTLPNTLSTYQEDTQLYNNYGTNIVFGNVNYSLGLKIQDYLTSNPNVSSITIVASMRISDSPNGNNGNIGDNSGYHVLAIDPDTYFDAVNFYPDYLESNPIARLFTQASKLRSQLNEPGTALFYRPENIDSGSKVSIPKTYIQNTFAVNVESEPTFTATGNFLYWPGLIDYNAYYSSMQATSYYFVTSISSIKSQMKFALNETTWKVLIKVLDNDVMKAKSVMKALNSTYGNVGDFTLWKTNQLKVDPEILIVYSILNANILFGIITGLLGIIIFNYVTLTERKRELSLLKSLGMVRKQIISMLLVEITVLSVIGILMGLAMGWFTSVLFIGASYGFSTNVPPMRIVFTKEYNLYFSLGTILIALLGSIIPALKISREKPGSLLRVD